MANKIKRATLLRIHDAEGRGPYRPGFSHRWTDKIRDGEEPPPIFMDFGWSVLSRVPKGWHAGCAFRTKAQLHRYFTQSELSRLSELGFRLAKIQKARIIAESEWQVLFAVRQPLRTFDTTELPCTSSNCQ